MPEPRPGADPAGQHRGEATDRTPFQVFAAKGMTVLPAPNPVALREPGLTALPRLLVHGLILGRQHIQGETLRSSWRFQGRHGSAGSQRQRQR